VLVCLWVGDTGAYLIGKRFGRTALAPRVSPKKTWEGAIGGLALSALAGLAAAAIGGFGPVSGALLGAVVGVFGILGDLFQSAWKRSLGLKDSGGLLPGHGGVLDRGDSLLLAFPAAALAVSSGWIS
jgi:phosphatidate cytidylyltransferase